MAGMLPGVESARRRRFHRSGSMDFHQRGALNKGFHGGALGNIAREAKERLDERLRTQIASEIKRHNSTGSMNPVQSGGGGGGGGGGEGIILGNVQREVFCSKKSRSRKFNWGKKMGWKSAEQDECVVCLEELKTGDILVHLPCAHRFHWNCVVPWLESSSHCPCCRMTTFA